MARRLGAYSAAATATAAATQSSANAAEVIHDILDVTAGNSPGLLFDMINGTTAAATAATGNAGSGLFRIASYDNYPYLAGPANSTLAGFVGPGSFGPVDIYPSRLPVGDTVGPLKNFAANIAFLSYGPYGYLSANFTNTRGFVGIQFNLDGELHYGWAEVTHLGAGLGTILHRFGYNDAPGEVSRPVETLDPGPPVVTGIRVNGDDLEIDFTGTDGVPYKLMESADLVTPFAATGVTGTTTGGVGTMTYVGGAAAGKNFVQVAEDPPVILFDDDLEGNTDDWTTVVNDGAGNTRWTLGTPAGSTGPISGADDSLNAWCTNLGDYGPNADISLRSPAIDPDRGRLRQTDLPGLPRRRWLRRHGHRPLPESLRPHSTGCGCPHRHDRVRF